MPRGVEFRFRAAALVATLLALSAIGCGDDPASGPEAGRQTAAAPDAAAERREVARTYRRYSDALYAGPPERLCALMTSHARRSAAGADGERVSCVKLYSATLDPEAARTPHPEPRVLRVEIKGDRAVLRIMRPGAVEFTRVRMTREQGAWKVDGDIDMGPY
jgi:hypothetical protein